ncbi:hypothetical protein HY485_04775 [Candidatus Woesearchaeota archaeon]|nr:hypothetical protein [Candidatus Woesearchaeota archaeon]
MDYPLSCCYPDSTGYAPSFHRYRAGQLPAYVHDSEKDGKTVYSAGAPYMATASSVADLVRSESSAGYQSKPYNVAGVDPMRMMPVDDSGLVHALTVSSREMPTKYNNLYLAKAQQDYFVTAPFLTHLLPTKFVDDASVLEEPAKEAFRKTTGKELPNNITIHLCTEKELRVAHERHSGFWSAGIQGFSINRGLKGISEVFVKKGLLDEVMVTLGHEIGHVISTTLNDVRDEEAKAFAFSIAWMRTIVDNNIAGLSNAINPNPAKNGIHDVGFEFVQGQLQNKMSAFDIFLQLANGVLSITKQLEQVILAEA